MSDENIAYDFLSRLNTAIKRHVRITLIGGNALALLGINVYTNDVDVCISSEDKDVKQFCIDYFKKYRVKVHFFIDGLFKNIRVKDYFKKAYPIDLPEFLNLEVRALNIYDIILTKLDRYDVKDQNALELILNQYELNKKHLDRRFKQYLKFYMGPQEDFTRNYRIFKKRLESKNNRK